MTKAEIIDQAWIQVMGGVLTQDANVKRVDIENLLPPVMAMVMTNAVFQGRAEARAELSVRSIGSYAPAIEYYKEVVVTPVLDEQTCVYCADLPKLLDLPNMWNTINARPIKSFSVDLIRVQSHASLIGAPETPQMFYWITSRGNGQKAWFPNLLEPVQDIVITAVVSPDALEGTDEVPCPPSVESQIIAMLVQTYRQQRGFPGDTILDDKDINDMAQKSRK